MDCRIQGSYQVASGAGDTGRYRCEVVVEAFGSVLD
jgi:hypothetical protein